MSAGSEFHATGPEKLKARSLNLVRRRCTTNFGAEHAAERSPGCDGVDRKVVDFMLMCLRTRCLRKLHLVCIRLKIFIAKFETLVDKMVSYSVYFEIKHQKMVNMCISVEYTCV